MAEYDKRWITEERQRSGRKKCPIYLIPPCLNLLLMIIRGVTQTELLEKKYNFLIISSLLSVLPRQKFDPWCHRLAHWISLQSTNVFLHSSSDIRSNGCHWHLFSHRPTLHVCLWLTVLLWLWLGECSPFVHNYKKNYSTILNIQNYSGL